MFKNNEYFYRWLTGMTDGDGSFVIHKNDKEYPLTRKFTFKISLFLPNSELLHFIKKELGVGIVSKPYKNMVTFSVSNRKDLVNTILPIFDKYPLLTVKAHRYSRFRRCLLIYDNPLIDMVEKDKMVTAIWGEELPIDYKAPIWNNYINDEDVLKKKLAEGNTQYHSDPYRIVTSAWLSGFIEADGNFFFTKMPRGILIHTFSISQKEDLHMLKAIQKMFNSNNTIYFKKNYTLDMSSTESIEKLINFLSGPGIYSTACMKGMKSVEYEMWKRSFFKYRQNFKVLKKIQDFIRKFRTRIYKVKL